MAELGSRPRARTTARAVRRSPPPARGIADRVGPVGRRRLVTWLPPLFVTLLFVPFALRENAWWEWNNAYWFLERQSAYIKAHGVPTLFLHHVQGVFYPMPVYYGGFAFTAVGLPALVLGAWPTFLLATAAFYVAGYFGVWWAARALGASRTLAVLPALAFTTTPYMVATFYGRGAWTEVVAVNAAAMVLGATVTLLWRPQGSRRPAVAALVVGTAFVAGTHNLTLLMAAIGLPVLLLALLPTHPGSARELARSATWVVGGVAVGLGLTLAWLLPNLWFGPDTAITNPRVSQAMMKDYRPYSAPGIVLSPVPAIPASRPSIFNYPQLPVLVWAWVLGATASIAVARRRFDASLRTLSALTAITVALVVLICVPGWWPHFPRLVQTIQMPVRLVPYAALAIALAAAVALAALPSDRHRRVLLAALVSVVAFQASEAAWITLHTRSETSSREPAPKHQQVPPSSEPASFASNGSMGPVQFLTPRRPTARRTTKADVGIGLADSVTSVHGTMTARGKVGDVVYTPIDWSPYVTVDGDAEIAGRDDRGFVLVRVNRVDADGRWRATAGPICEGLCLDGLHGDAPWQLAVGRIVSLLSALTVLGVGGWWLGAAALRRRRATP